MKKLTVLLALVMISQFIFAQRRFGIRAGLNIANQKISAKYMGEKNTQHGKAIPSFHLGAMGDLQLNDFLSLQTSLILTGKGANFEAADSMGNPTTAKLRPFYIELPIALVYKHSLPTTNATIYGGVGPALAFGVFGKAKTGSESQDAFQKEGFKRFDLGLNLTAGLELPTGLQFSFHFSPGLINIANIQDPDVDINWKNEVVGFSFGYFLTHRK